MKVLHVINTLDVGGAERLLCDMAPHFAAKGVQISILVLALQDRRLYERMVARGIEVMVSPFQSLYSPRHVAAIHDLVRARGIDLIHVHLFPSMYWAALANLCRSRVPVLLTEHNTRNGRRRVFFRPIERLMYRRFARIACVSDQAAEALREWLPELADRICVVENGIDLTAFSLLEDGEISTKCTVISVGRLTKQKSMDVLIRAVAGLPSVTAWIVGDGPLRQDLEQLAVSLHVSGRVRFLGARMDVAALFGSAAIYVQPSAWEGFGLAAVEAMRAGLPLIVSDVPGLREVVGDAGFTFTAGSDTELADRLRNLMQDASLRAELGARARARAMRYSISQTVTRYTSLYDSIQPVEVSL